MIIKIIDLYNDDAAKFTSLSEAQAYYVWYNEECEEDWWPRIIINKRVVPLDEFLEMCRKEGV